MEMEDLAADIAGTQLAVSSVLRALIATHPDPSAFQEQLEAEEQRSMAHLIAAPVPERAVDAFHLVLGLCLEPIGSTQAGGPNH